MSVTIPALLIASVCLAAVSIAAFVLNRRANARKNAPVPAADVSASDLVVLDLAGRVPSKHRRPCGRKDGSGKNCDDCENKHTHDHGDHGHGHGHCHDKSA